MAQSPPPHADTVPAPLAAGQGGVRSGNRSWPARVAIAAGSLLAMAAAVILGLLALLSSGPISTPFLRERVAEALERRLGDHVDVNVGETKLERTSDGIEVHIYDVVFRDFSGKEIMRSPEALVSFDPLQLAAFRLAPRRLVLKGMAVRAVVHGDGDIQLLTGQPLGSAEQATRLEDAFAALVAAARTGTLSGLRDISLTNATLVIDDRRVGKDVAFEKVSAVFEARGEGVSALSGSISRFGAAMPYRIEAAMLGDGAKLDVTLRDVPLRIAETIGGTGALPFKASSRALLHASLTLDGAARPTAGRLHASLTPGSIEIPAVFAGPVAIDEARIEAQWSGATDRIEHLRMSYAGDGTRIVLAGVVRKPTDSEPYYRFEGKTETVTLAPLRPQAKPLIVTQGDVKASISRKHDHFAIESLTLDGPETAIRLSGHVRKEVNGPSLKLDLATGRMPAHAALAWWPGGFSGEARNWLVGAVKDGVMNELSIALDFPPPVLRAMIAEEPLPMEAVKLDVSVENATVQALEGLPPIIGLAGRGQLNSLTAQFQAARGHVDLRGQGKRLQLADGLVQISRLDTWTPDITISFRAQAAAEHVAEFMISPALKDLFAFQANPQDIRGQFDGRAKIGFPLGKPLGKGDIVTEVTASLKGVAIERAIGKDRLENANLTIAADKTGVEVKGEGRWQGIPVTVSLENDAQDRSTVTVLSFTLDDAGQKRLGLGGQFTGPLPVKVKALRADGGDLKAQAEIDLTRAAIDGLIPGFQKPAGRPGKLSFEAVERPRGYTLQNLALDSGAASLRGQAEVQQDGSLISARLSLFRLSPGDNVRLDFDRAGAGSRVAIRGNNFDARPFLRAITQDAGAKSERDIELDLKTTLLSGYGGEVLTSAEVRLQRRNGQMRQFSATGKLNGKSLSANGQASDRAAPISIESDDAGALLRFLDIYSRMSGGDLSAQVRPGARETSGYFVTRNFSLRNEPALRRLTQGSSAEGQAAGGNGADFTKMRLDFSRSGSAVTIKDSVIFGPLLGITFNGVVDQARDRISLSGTYIPAYGLNNAFAQIPVIGNILGGGRNEGLLAVTFGVSGKVSSPEVTVNPLSAVTPGIFRKLFEFRNDRSGVTGSAGAAARGPVMSDPGSR